MITLISIRVVQVKARIDTHETCKHGHFFIFLQLFMKTNIILQTYFIFNVVKDHSLQITFTQGNYKS